MQPIEQNKLPEDYLARDQVEVISEFDRSSAIEAIVANGFSRSNIIGTGRYGTLYKVVLRTSQVVAVEWVGFMKEILLSPEIRNISQDKHPNIMNLLGNFLRGSERMLVYEFMENGTLNDILYGGHQLPWTLYFKIIIGVARGINFLNRNCALRKRYSSIDPCNIFLDADMNPKIAVDYCGRTIQTTYYVPPEGYRASELYASSDIYSFGVLVLDLLSMGKLSKQSDLITVVRGLWKERFALDLLRESLGVEFSSEEAQRCIEIALSCTRFEPRDRPNISHVVKALEGDPE